MRGREQDVSRRGVEERAGGLADTRGHARRVSSLHVHQIDLIEGISRLTLALEDQLRTVLRPVAFAGAPAFDRQTPDSGEKVAFRRLALREEGRANLGHDVKVEGPAEAGHYVDCGGNGQNEQSR